MASFTFRRGMRGLAVRPITPQNKIESVRSRRRIDPTLQAAATPATRIATIDVLRGLAIFIMVPANMAAFVYVEPHAFWFRVLSSFAAPVFIGVAGMMIVLVARSENYGVRHYLVRGALLLAVAVLVDVLIFNITPFYSFDVLYLIGIACPLTYFYARLPRIHQWSLVALIFLVTPILQWTFGYTDDPGDYVLWESESGTGRVVPENPTGLLQHLLIDGSFPVFPWLGMSFAGATTAQVFFLSARQSAPRGLSLAAVVLLIAGVMAWRVYPGPMFDRDGYSELFYPPTPGFMVTAFGAVLALLWTIHQAPNWTLYAPLRWLGECSLLMYVLHLAIIIYLLKPLFPDRQLPTFLVINFATVGSLSAIALIIREMKSAWPHRPYLARFLFGG
jgi:uncharacterized membrane protein